MNPKIVGWRNYYRTKTDGKWMRSLDWYILCTFVRWYNKKHQQLRKRKDITLISRKLREKGLQKWLYDVTPYEGKPHVRFDEGKEGETPLTYSIRDSLSLNKLRAKLEDIYQKNINIIYY